MNPNPNLQTAVTYHPAPSILYVVEADQTRLIDQKRGLSWSLQGLEAILWDFLTSGYSYQKTIHFISLWPNLPGTDAEEVMLTMLDDWCNQGILEKTFDDQPDP